MVAGLGTWIACGLGFVAMLLVVLSLGAVLRDHEQRKP